MYTKAQEGSQENNLSTRYRIVVAMFYIVVIIIGIIIIIMYTVRAIPSSFLYAGIGLLVVMFFFIFPFGFTIYGVLILSMKYSKANVKITSFMIVSNFLFLVVFGIDIPILLGYIFGWDLCGFFYGQARVSILLCNPLVFAGSISYILFVPARFKQFYTCCAKKQQVKPPH